jgi:hypothetical protein
MPSLDHLIRLRDFSEHTGITPRTISNRLAANGAAVYRDPRDRRHLLANREDLNRLVELEQVNRSSVGRRKETAGVQGEARRRALEDDR